MDVSRVRTFFGLPIPDIKYGKIISDQTYYGLIWEGQVIDHTSNVPVPVPSQDSACVVKMVLLSSGAHYNLEKKIYYHGHNKINGHVGIFEQNENKPYYHTYFAQRRCMSESAFLTEANNLVKMSQINLSPAVYGVWIENHQDHADYGFIVMDRADCSLKDLLLTRHLTKSENKVVINLINTMHEKYHLVHRDLKPSNIGVYFDDDMRIDKCRLFDCQKVKSKKDMSDSQFKSRIRSDWSHFQKHGGSAH